jgi:hypothetical protein
MKRLLLILAVFMMATLASYESSFAQATRTWVSGVGDDANPCSRTAPCKTFAGAISKTAAGGEIDVLDPGGFGAVTITKSITIRAIGFDAGVLVVGTNGININAAATDSVMIDGLSINGAGNGYSSNGINVSQAGDVYIRNCIIQGFNQSSSSGINLSNTAARTRVTVESSTILYNTNGISVNSSANNGHLKVFNSQILSNDVDGIFVTGTGNDVSIANNQIIGRSKSLDIQGGATVKSYGNNMLTSGDAPTTTTPLN